MRAQVYKGDPLDPDQASSVPGQWQMYCPRTNLIWLLFLLKNLLKNRKPENPRQVARQPLADRSANPRIKNHRSKSVKDTLSKDRTEQQVSAMSDLQAKLLERLHTVCDLLNLEGIEESMCCAGDLVAFAVDSQWLNEIDFLCGGE